MDKICLICENAGKYKCPKCSGFNCSLPCFKLHKENGKCEQPNQKIEQEIIEDKRADKINFFTTVDTVPQERLQELDKSEKIKNLLKNPHLRNFLEEINSASNSWNAMKLAMMEPIFLEFADECMKAIEPQGSQHDLNYI